MMNPKYAAMAMKHWKTWLPNKVAELKAAGEFEAAIQAAAIAATSRVVELMQMGYQQHEAEEVALREFVLLAPEPEDEDDEEAIELARLDREYNEMMREQLRIQDEAGLPD